MSSMGTLLSGLEARSHENEYVLQRKHLPVKVVKVDVVNTKPPQRVLHLLSRILRATINGHILSVDAELARNKYLIACTGALEPANQIPFPIRNENTERPAAYHLPINSSLS